MQLDSDAITYAREALLSSTDFIGHPDRSKIITEALFHMCGGSDAGLVVTGHKNHWWLQDANGYVWDPSWDEFSSKDYKLGQQIPIDKEPTTNAKELMDRIEFELIGFTDY